MRPFAEARSRDKDDEEVIRLRRQLSEAEELLHECDGQYDDLHLMENTMTTDLATLRRKYYQLIMKP